jgi:hypothetical protein
MTPDGIDRKAAMVTAEECKVDEAEIGRRLKVTEGSCVHAFAFKAKGGSRP